MRVVLWVLLTLLLLHGCNAKKKATLISQWERQRERLDTMLKQRAFDLRDAHGVTRLHVEAYYLPQQSDAKHEAVLVALLPEEIALPQLDFRLNAAAPLRIEALEKKRVEQLLTSKSNRWAYYKLLSFPVQSDAAPMRLRIDAGTLGKGVLMLYKKPAYRYTHPDK